MEYTSYESDSSCASISAIEERKQRDAIQKRKRRDKLAGKDPFERALKDAVKQKLDKIFPLPPTRPSEEDLANLTEEEKDAEKKKFSIEYKRITNQRNHAKADVELAIRRQMHGQASPVVGTPQASPVGTPTRCRGVTPSPMGTPMPVQMMDLGVGETPQCHKTQSLFERMLTQVMENNSQQTSALAAALIAGNNAARQDTQEKNSSALAAVIAENKNALDSTQAENKKALDSTQAENKKALDSTQAENKKALDFTIERNQRGIQQINDQHKEQNMDTFKQVVSLMSSNFESPLPTDGVPETPMVRKNIWPTGESTSVSKATPPAIDDSSNTNASPSITNPIQPIYSAPPAAKKRPGEEITPPVAGKQQKLFKTPRDASSLKKPVSSMTRGSSSLSRPSGLPPRAPASSSAAKSGSGAKVFSHGKKKMVSKRGKPPATSTRFVISSPDGMTYTLGDSTGWQDEVVDWSMSRHRASFLLRDGTVAVFPFLKREEESGGSIQNINKTLLHSGKGWRVIWIAAHGPHTFTLERDQGDARRQIKCQTGDQPTKVLQIKGLMPGVLIDRFFPGEGYLVVVYQNGLLDLVRNYEVDGEAQVDEKWRDIVTDSFGEHCGKTIGNVHVGGLFVLVELVASAQLFCIPLHSDQEGPLKCEIEKGLLVLPRSWSGGASVSCGHNHCVVHAIHNSSPEGRAYVAGCNKHFQLGHGGNSSGILKVVRGLTTRNVTAVFAAESETFAIDEMGRLACFGEKWCDADKKEPTIIRECNFQDLAVGDSAQHAMVRGSDGHFGLVKIGKSVSHVQLDGQIVGFRAMKTGGGHVGVKIFMSEAKQNTQN